ncbi:MAG: hypothetical protein M3T56_14925 [Chloroflexota bacterium]|nr:hypothetical protein [Chloroflexota bacterium]
MAIVPARRVVTHSADLLALSDSNSLIQIAQRHVVITGDDDPMAVAEKYGLGTQQMIGTYSLHDAQALGSYLASVGTLASDEKARLEERIISDGSIFRESRR